VGVRGADQDLFAWNSGALRGDFFGFIQKLGPGAEVIQNDHRQRRRSIIKNKCASMERIMGALGGIRAKTAGHVHRGTLSA